MKHRPHIITIALAFLACIIPTRAESPDDKTPIAGSAIDAANDFTLVRDASVTSGATLKQLPLSEFINIPGFFGSVSATELGYLDGVTSSIQTQLSGKQATLVSGTNIKTVNGASMLGSGDLVVGGGSFSSLTGQPTDNANLSSALSAKAPAGNVFYATNYGVVADGVTDDRIALQTAILAASAVATPTNRATVILPAGTMIVSRGTAVGAGPVPTGGLPNPDGGGYWKFCILLKNNVNVIGQGIDSTVIKIKDDVVEETSVLFADDLGIGYGGTGFSENIMLKDFTVNCNATARNKGSEGEGINIKTAKNLWIESVRVWNAENDGFDIDGGSDITLVNCVAEDCNGSGIHIVAGGADKVVISNGIFRRNAYVRRVQQGGGYAENGAGIDIATSNCVISNCLFENNAVELQALSGYTVMEGCVVTHNPTSLNLAGIVAGWPWTSAVGVGSLEIRNSKILSSAGSHSIEILQDWPRTVIEGCEVRGNIKCTSGKDLIVTGNYLNPSVSRSAIELTLQSGVSTIMNNVFEASASHIRVDNSNNGKVIGNTFKGANYDIQFFAATSDNWEVTGNTFQTTGPSKSIYICPGSSGGTFANNIGDDGGFSVTVGFAGSATNHRFINNLISTLVIEGAASTGNLFERNIITGSISHTSSTTFASNTWRGNTGAGCAGIFYGTATLTSGSVTINSAAANSARKWGLTRQTIGASTAIGELALGTITANSSFVVNSLSASGTPNTVTGDVSTFYWEILE